MNVLLQIKNKKHEAKFNENIGAYTNQTLHNHVILGIAALPFIPYNQIMLMKESGYAAKEITTGVIWISFFLVLLVIGLSVRKLPKRFQNHHSKIRLCLEILYTLISGYLAWNSYERAHMGNSIEMRFISGWWNCFITMVIFEIITTWGLKIMCYFVVILVVFVTIHLETGNQRALYLMLPMLIYLTASTYFNHREGIRRFIEKLKIQEETQAFKAILDQTTDGILIYGLKEGPMYRNWEKKRYTWWDEEISVEDNLKDIRIEQKKMLNDNSILVLNTLETNTGLETDEGTLSGLLKYIARSLHPGVISSLDETQQTHNIMVINGRVEGRGQEVPMSDRLGEGDVIISTARSKEKGGTTLLEIRVMTLIFREKPALALIFHDVTERSTIDMLEDNNNYKSRLLASVSHELRTPLNASINFIQSAIEDPKCDETIKENLLKPSLVSNRLLLHLINDILDFSQISANKLRLVFEQADIKKTIDDCLNLVSLQAKRKGISLSANYVIKSATSQISTDHNRLKQIVLNLLSNAIKFTLEGGIKVSVTLTDSEEYSKVLSVEVSDTGIGISDENQKRLFQAYEKIELGKRVALNSTGVGLGLVISNNLVQMLGPADNIQSMKFQSKIGHGSKFSFTIVEKTSLDDYAPFGKINASADHNRLMEELSHCETQAKSCFVVPKFESVNNTFTKNKLEISPETRRIECNCPSILVVDDDVFNITALEMILGKFGIVCSSAFNGQQAINKIRERERNMCMNGCGQFKLVFMDCNMPILDGFEATTQLKELMKRGEIERIPIIGCTALVQETERRRAIECGMDECCSKPVDRDRISHILKTFFLE